MAPLLETSNIIIDKLEATVFKGLIVLQGIMYEGNTFEMMLFTLWIYLPGFLVNTFAMMWGKWFPKTGFGPWPIDGGRIHKDGNRLLGDGKTWNGLIGGSLTSGILCVLMTYIPETGFIISPIEGNQGWLSSAFLLGTFLGLTSLIGDSTGSYFKRRSGMKREGDVSSKAPLLDTLPFAISVFAFGQLVLTDSAHGSRELLVPIFLLLVITPILHRTFNLIGYKIGWKDVPY